MNFNYLNNDILILKKDVKYYDNIIFNDVQLFDNILIKDGINYLKNIDIDIDKLYKNKYDVIIINNHINNYDIDNQHNILYELLRKIEYDDIIDYNSIITNEHSFNDIEDIKLRLKDNNILMICTDTLNDNDYSDFNIVFSYYEIKEVDIIHI